MIGAFIDFRIGLLQQNVFIHDYDLIETKNIKCSLQEIPDYIISSGAEELTLSGDPEYFYIIQKEIKKKELIKYGKHRIKIITKGDMKWHDT